MVLAVVALGSAAPADAHVLGKTRAKRAARAALKAGAARRKAGDASTPTFTGPTCARRSNHRFVCTTTVRGTSACDPGEAACDGPAPWEIAYVVDVRFRGAHSNRLR